MNIIEAIRERRSVRNYNGQPLSRAVTVEIEKAIAETTDPFGGAITVRLGEFDLSDGFRPGTYGVIKGATTYFMIAAADTAATDLSIGFVFEQIVLRAWQLGLGTCWIGGTFSQNDFRRAISHSSAQEIFPVGIISPLGHSTQKTRFAERMMRRFAKSNSRKPFDKLFTGIDAPSDALLANAGEDLKAMRSLESCVKIALEMVRLAPSSRNCQPWRAIVVRQDSNIISVDFRCITDNKFSDIDMGIALCHFFDSMNALGQYGNIILNTEKSRGAFSWIPELNR